MVRGIRLGLSIKLAASFAFFAIVAISAVGYVSYATSFSSLDLYIHDGMMEHASTIEYSMRSIYDEEADDAEIHAHNPQNIEDTLSILNNSSIEARANLRKNLAAYVMFDDEVDAVLIIDAANGHVIMSTDPVYEDKNVSETLYFKEGILQKNVHVNYYGPVAKKSASVVSAPMYHDGTVFAIVAMRLNDRQLMDIVNDKGGLGTTGVVYLLDRSGLIINTVSDREYMQTSASEGARRGLAGETGVREYINHDGIPVVGAYKWVPEYNILILVERELEEAHAPMMLIKERIVTTAAALLSIFFIFIILFTNYLTKPVRMLNNGMEKVEDGDYSAYVKPMYNDELGELAERFNTMAEKLQRTTGELRSIFKSADAGIVLLDTDTRILRVNEWITARFGEVVGHPRCHSYWNENTVCYECAAKKALESGKSETAEKVQIKDGVKLTYMIRASPVFGSEGKPIAVVMILTDITTLLHMKEELQQYSTKLESMVKEKTKDLSDKLAEIEKMNDLFVDRELTYIETKAKFSKALDECARLEEELRRMRGETDG